MLALTCHGGHDVRVDTVPDPILQEPDDIILKVNATAICGSYADLSSPIPMFPMIRSKIFSTPKL